MATILLALEHTLPLDEVIYCEVRFTSSISGEHLEHREFIHSTAIPFLKAAGIKVTVVRDRKTYLDLFCRPVTRGPQEGRGARMAFVRKMLHTAGSEKQTAGEVHANPKGANYTVCWYSSRRAEAISQISFWLSTVLLKRQRWLFVSGITFSPLSMSSLHGEVASSALMQVGRNYSICTTTILTCGTIYLHCRSCLIKQQSVLIESIALTR